MSYDFKTDGIVGYQTLSKIGEQILETPEWSYTVKPTFCKNTEG